MPALQAVIRSSIVLAVKGNGPLVVDVWNEGEHQVLPRAIRFATAGRKGDFARADGCVIENRVKDHEVSVHKARVAANTLSRVSVGAES
jgi:hypothetical protein